MNSTKDWIVTCDQHNNLRAAHTTQPHCTRRHGIPTLLQGNAHTVCTPHASPLSRVLGGKGQMESFRKLRDCAGVQYMCAEVQESAVQ
jgi:hypothetical protein